MIHFGHQTTAICYKVRLEKFLYARSCSVLLLLETCNDHAIVPRLAGWRRKGHMQAYSLPIAIPKSEATLGYPVFS